MPTIERKVMQAMAAPCAQCPWRKSNRSKRHTGGWYTKANLRRLWKGLRTGEAPGMTCHPTDPNNPLPEGWNEVPKEIETKECAGSLILITRELKMLEKMGVEYFQSRTRARLTKAGVTWWGIARCSLANTPLGGPPIPILEECEDVGGLDA